MISPAKSADPYSYGYVQYVSIYTGAAKRPPRLVYLGGLLYVALPA
jgi:hypothetical protein